LNKTAIERQDGAQCIVAVAGLYGFYNGTGAGGVANQGSKIVGRRVWRTLQNALNGSSPEYQWAFS